MKDGHIQLLIKIFLISHAYLFFFQKIKFSGYILILAFFIFLFNKKFQLANEFIEKFAKFIGEIILKVLLSIFYVFIILPLALFNKKDSSDNTTFIQITKDSKVNFKKMW